MPEINFTGNVLKKIHFVTIILFCYHHILCKIRNKVNYTTSLKWSWMTSLRNHVNMNQVNMNQGVETVYTCWKMSLKCNKMLWKCSNFGRKGLCIRSMWDKILWDKMVKATSMRTQDKPNQLFQYFYVLRTCPTFIKHIWVNVLKAKSLNRNTSQGLLNIFLAGAFIMFKAFNILIEHIV